MPAEKQNDAVRFDHVGLTYAGAGAPSLTDINFTAERFTLPLPSIKSMALPQRMGIYSWAATLTAATTRLHTTNRLMRTGLL